MASILRDARLPCVCWLLAFSSLALAAESPPAAADNAPAGSGAARAGDANTRVDDGVEEVIVTARRRGESLQHAAIAITAISGDAIVNANVTRPGGLSAVVPSLQVQDVSGPYSLFYVRGVGNFAANGLSDAALAFNFDGVSVSRSGTSGFFYDLERVEVLKGPQGTLYGRNATGGAINVISKKPELGTYAAEAMVQSGNFSALRIDSMLNVPLGEKSAVRAAAFHTEHDGYLNDGSYDQDDIGGRLSLLSEVSESLRVSLVADYFDQGGNGSGSTVIGVTNPFLATPPSFGPGDRVGLFSQETAAYLATQRNAISRNTYFPFENIIGQNNRFWGVSATVDWINPLGTLTIIPAYRDNRLDYISFGNGVMIREDSHAEQTSIEARLASASDQALSYIVGAFYFEDTNAVPRYHAHQQYSASFQSYTATTDSQAVFANLTYTIAPELRLTGGIRYTRDRKAFQGGQFSSNAIICTRPGFTPCPDADPIPYTTMAALPPQFFNPNGTITTRSDISNSNADEYSRVTWRLGADWDITDRNLLYASFETGFKSGGFFFSADRNFYKPETLRAYTLGSKNRFLENRLQANVELFHWKYHDQQISHLSRDSLGNLIFPTENVGLATLKGVELDLQARPLRGTLLNANVLYNDAVYNQFVYTTPNQNGGTFNGTTCPNVGAPGSFYTVDCSGRTPPNAPKWSVSAGVQQTIPLPEGANLVGNARVHYQTKTLTGGEFLPVEYQDSYSTWDFDLTYTTDNERFSVGAYINNAFDKNVLVFSFPTPLSGFATGIFQAPRTYGVRVGARL